MISMIAALTPGYVIGQGNDLPWRIPDDLRHFKRSTLCKPVIMGRRNYRAIGRPLPHRQNIVMSRQPDFQAPGCQVVGDAQAALEATAEAPEIMIIGGAEIYRVFLPRADRLYLTWVATELVGDTWFPKFDPELWTVTAEHWQPAGEGTPYPLHFQTLDRR
ncbi:dihydrofolate reductase [Aquisalimonas sp.]|uniref:dihydrofolate reductase n=1 Tax=Aquisalimonas sp. TaxID=1872621 RepID=UPI0025B8EB75|nr:dihydrofolate reductase [Aquisalimonas sp.]